jgi:hypothetical protein
VGKKRDETWTSEPEERIYASAGNFLSLLFAEADVTALLGRLRGADTVHREAKDLLRAAGLRLLSADDPHVAHDLKRVGRGDPLQPVLLVRGSAREGRSLVVADGYHRICASYHLEEDAEIPCRLVALPPE